MWLEQVADVLVSVTSRPFTYVNEPSEEAWAARRTYDAAE